MNPAEARPFHDRDGVIWLDGVFVPWRDAGLHVLSHGLHYGGAVFEGVRVYGGRPFKAGEHLRRLAASAAELGYELAWTTSELERAVTELIERQGITDGYVRPVAWRGSERIAVGGAGLSAHTAVAAWEWPHVFDPAKTGISLATSRWRRPHPDTAPVRAKASALYCTGTLARDEAEAAGCDDALLLDWRGDLAEATGANLFLVIGGELHTPVPECFLDGITRRTVIGIAAGLGIPVRERRIAPSELADAEEVFLTGTAYEIQPVAAIDGRVFGVGEVSASIAKSYADLVRGRAGAAG
ncbi:branched-chain amino acid transaminase [Glycomyces albidus]|uniref:Branched-chain-amino-acid aminotransferase n=1 Tax=Glycomyces albidus TaxID=2656774 RepID=A0A6L5GDV6_9ACTN|nr:branched-chain amino acid transaminase [Glycomyces albidus]MQM27818.1 branched-chain amino acid transaminase [Glycomyces albidus]